MLFPAVMVKLPSVIVDDVDPSGFVVVMLFFVVFMFDAKLVKLLLALILILPPLIFAVWSKIELMLPLVLAVWFGVSW